MTAHGYDEILYPSATNTGCHVRRHEAVARLFGMQPTPLPTARVLEVGCGDGWNLFPQAEQYPGATFVGFDYANRPIEIGQRVVDELGLRNVELRCADIMELDSGLGEFDYVIAHGFYSWIPEQVRVRFLALLPNWLAPQGVAYVSYNVLPGWRTREIARDYMRFETRGIDDTSKKINTAREAFRFLAANATVPEYRALLEREYDMVRQRPDGYLFHDHLAEINQAWYFTDVLARMRSAGLDYLGEAELASMYPADVSPEARDKLSGLSVDDAEQLLDFLRNREFRATLFRRADAEVDRAVGPERLMPFHATLAEPASCSRLEVSLEEPLIVETGGREMQIGDRLQQAILLELADAFPAACACGELPLAAERRLTVAGIAVPLDQSTLTGHTLQFVWQLATMGIVELAVHPPPVARGVPAYPQATRAARHQAGHGMPHASNLFHRAVWLEPVMRRLLSLCDGDHAAEAIVDIVSREIEAGNVKGTAPDMSQMQAVAALELLAREGFFLRED